MERSEPTLIPQWLKSAGSSTAGGTTTHQIASSPFQSDDHGVSKSQRSKSFVNGNDHDIGRSVLPPDRTTSSYFHRSSSSNGSARSRSFGRSNRDNRDWEKDLFDSSEKDHRHRDFLDPLGNILLPSRFEKDALKRSQSMTTGKRVETWSRKVGGDSNKSNLNNSNGLIPGGSAIGGVQKAAFERDFPSLGAEEKTNNPEIKRVSSPGLSSAIQNLPMGISAVIGGDGWTSALAEVPVIAGTNGIGGSVQKMASATTTSVAPSTATGLNMAETVAQGPSRAQATPQLSTGTQRLEELAIKQSRQLIPMTPSLPKALVPNSLEKPKPKNGPQQHQMLSSHLVNHTQRGAPAKTDITKAQSSTTSVGKLQVLKPARERNAVSPTAKDNTTTPSPTTNIGGKVVANSSLLAVAPSVVGSSSVPIRLANSTNERKPATMATSDKRPMSQAQSRNDFFNTVRKKSIMPNASSAGPRLNTGVSPSKPDQTQQDGSVVNTVSSKDDELVSSRDDEPTETFTVDCSTEKMVVGNGDNDDASDRPDESLVNVKNNSSSSDTFLYSEEEEAAFLRSLGWEESAEEDGGLTEEEISSFYRNVNEYIKSKPSSRISQGLLQQNIFVPLHLRGESVEGSASSGFGSSSDPKSEF